MTNPSQRLTMHTGVGRTEQVDPAEDPYRYQDLLLLSRDERVRQQRAQADTASPLEPGRNTVMEVFNRQQEDGATGLGGYNRQWVPFFEGPRVAADNRLQNAVKGIQ